MFVHRFLHIVMRIYIRLICRVRLRGLEHIPAQGPFILITNHLGSVDPPLIFSRVPVGLNLTGMAASAHRNDFFVGWLMDRAGLIWVRRGEIDRTALRQALDTLASGRPFGLAPEGTRSRTGALIEGKSGTAFLAIKSGAPILPIALTGTEKVFPSLRRLRRATVQARFLPAFNLPARGDGPRSEHVQYCTDLIMTRLASALPESYRGFYADHPLIGYWEQLDASGMADRPEWKRTVSAESLDGELKLA